MQIRIPAPLQETATTLGLRRWVAHRDFPRDAYFGAIDEFSSVLSRFTPSGDPEPRQLAVLLAVAVDEEGALLTYVLDKATLPISDDATWLKICQAAAWVILQRYNLEVDNGTWP
jgi:hypothetical protein